MPTLTDTLEFDLLDNGTLDTVLGVHCKLCDATWEHVYSDTSDYRDEAGCLDLDAWLVDVANEIWCEHCQGE